MKESYGEGLANHTGPKLCADAREGMGEALAGVRAGGVLSRERANRSGRRRCPKRRKATPDRPTTQGLSGPRAVGDLQHVRKLLAQELGDPCAGLETGIKARAVNPDGRRRR
jgi:hypothetical protein